MKCLEIVGKEVDFHSRWGVTGEIGVLGVGSRPGFGCGLGIFTILGCVTLPDGRGSVGGSVGLVGVLLSFGKVGSGSGASDSSRVRRSFCRRRRPASALSKVR